MTGCREGIESPCSKKSNNPQETVEEGREVEEGAVYRGPPCPTALVERSASAWLAEAKNGADSRNPGRPPEGQEAVFGAVNTV